MGILGPVTLARYDDWDWGLGVLLGGVVNGIQTFLPRLLAHGEGGHIVNTSSMAGVVPMPGAAIYITAKAARHRALGGAAERARREGIGVSAFCPGPVQTNIREGGRTRPERYGDSGYAELERELEARPNSPLWMDPLECGERVLARHPPRRPVHLHAPRVPGGRRRALPRDARLVPGRAAEQRAGGGDRLPALQPRSSATSSSVGLPELAARRRWPKLIHDFVDISSRADYARPIVRLSSERMDAATPRAAESCAASMHCRAYGHAR